MDKPRPLLAMIICVAIFLFWTIQQSKNQRARPEAERQRQAPGAEAGPGANVARPPRPGTAPAGGAAAPPAPRPERPSLPEEAAELRSVGDAIQVRFAARGGGIDEVWLPAFRPPIDPADPRRERPAVDELILLPAGERLPPELALGIEKLFPGGVEDDPGEAAPPVDLETEVWAMEVDEAAKSVTFSTDVNEAGGVEGGVRIRKRVALRAEAPDEPALRVELTFENRGASLRTLQYRLSGPAGVRSEAVSSPGSDIQVVHARFSQNGPLIVGLTAAGERDVTSWSEKPAYIGIQNNYFAAVLAPVAEFVEPEATAPMPLLQSMYKEIRVDPVSAKRVLDAEFQGRALEGLRADERAELEKKAVLTASTHLVAHPVEIAPGQSVTHRYLLYLGPRKDSVLGRWERLGLDEINDHGITTWIVRLFMGILELFHFLLRSWGLAIVCLTLVVRTALHPLNRKQQAGMMRYQKKMQKVQPQLNELKQKFKDDRMRMNQEMQKLFKEHGINPAQMMGGCLIVLLQFPIWIGLIETLRYSIDLRQAPFLGWIRDLSMPDQLMVFDHTIRFLPTNLNLLPLLYVVLMLIQQRMQPKATDPQARQTQRTMTIMMVAFGFIFYNFASGLLVYFLTSAIYGIIESRAIKAKLAREEERGERGAYGTADGDDALGGANGGGSRGGGVVAAAGGAAPLYTSSRVLGKPKKPKQKKPWQR